MKLTNVLKGFLRGQGVNSSREQRGKAGRVGAMKLTNFRESLKLAGHGYAVIDDGVLVVDSIATSKRYAMDAFLSIRGIDLTTNCVDDDCDCVVPFLHEFAPKGIVVEVDIRVVNV